MAGRTNKPEDGMIDLSVTVDDERLCIPLNIKTKEGTVTHNLYFNPLDIAHIAQHLLALDTLRSKEPEFSADNLEALNEYTEQFDHHFDGIFGTGSCREVFRYIGFRMTILDRIFEGVTKGVEWHNKQAEKHVAEARKEAAEAAKAESKAFIANQS